MPLSRRSLLKTAGGLAASAIVSPVLAAPPPKKLRIAHLTDIHVQPEKSAGPGMAKALAHVNSLEDKPQLILTGGDQIMDSFAAERSRTQAQWDVFKKVLSDETDMPLEHCIGNHDVWGWNKSASKTTGTEPDYGKKWVMETLGLPAPYRSFDRHGWHFVVLDSTHPLGESSYIAKLDDAQWQWLEQDLAKTDPKTPVLVLSHIPILTVTGFPFEVHAQNGDWITPASWVHVDANKLKNLFAKHPNVKLALSGHMHLVDRCEYNGVTYICSGAVSGNWWEGRHIDCEPGYSVIDLHADGRITNGYIEWGWSKDQADEVLGVSSSGSS